MLLWLEKYKNRTLSPSGFSDQPIIYFFDYGVVIIIRVSQVNLLQFIKIVIPEGWRHDDPIFDIVIVFNNVFFHFTQGFKGTRHTHDEFEILENFNIRKGATVNANAHKIVKICFDNSSSLQLFEVCKKSFKSINGIVNDVILLLISNLEVLDNVVMIFKIFKIV